MKKLILLALFSFTIAITTANAQGGFQRRTPEERLKIVHDKIDSAFQQPGTDVMAKLDTVFINYYKAQDKIREEFMASGERPDDATREAMRTKMQELIVERDGKLQKILSEAQYQKFKDEIEPAMRPQRGSRNN